MLKSDSLNIICHLTDRNGNILNPYEQNAIIYTELSLPKNRPQKQIELPSGKTCVINIATVLIEGFIAFCVNGRNMSNPIPFCIIKYICLYAPKDTVLSFAVNKFECCAAFIKDKKTADQIKISICIDTIVNSKAKVNIIVPIADSSLSIINKACISADRIFDSVSFCSETCLLCKRCC
jgi:hypothetical protein